MRMPNCESAIVRDDKLLQYLFNPSHPVGGASADLFDRLLGINRTYADVLRRAVLKAAREDEAVAGNPSKYGQKFEIRSSLSGTRGSYTVPSIWIINTASDVPERVTAYIAK
jgi:hypothetical protein